ncbi:hypothetical protein ACFL6N_00800 [Thermodesulfobacteriota bacterium]
MMKEHSTHPSQLKPQGRNSAIAVLVVWIMAVTLVLTYGGTALGGCGDSVEALQKDHRDLRKYLQSLSLYSQNCRVDGLILCNGTNPLSGMIFIGKVPATQSRQVFLFFHPQEKRKLAYVWVENNGKALTIPKCQEECGPETAGSMIYGGNYPHESIEPGGVTVVVNFVSEEWLSILRLDH